MDERQEPTIRSIIDQQRLLSQSKNRFERYIGTLLVAGALDENLDKLTDRQIGRLLSDEVERDLGIVQPEATICGQARQRLYRSPYGQLTAADIEKQHRYRCCPNCGAEMLLIVGIDEPDYWECACLDCGLKEYVADEGEAQ
jgi:hypothetical protein